VSKIKKLLLLVMLCISLATEAQSILQESLCYILEKAQIKNEQIIVIGNKSECKEFNSNKILYTSQNDVDKLLTSRKSSLLETKIIKIENAEIQIMFTWYNISKKGRKIKKGLEGSILLTYCFDCNISRFKLCNEQSNFH
jgi:hypothetical protein